jgi:hypothetical protein
MCGLASRDRRSKQNFPDHPLLLASNFHRQYLEWGLVAFPLYALRFNPPLTVLITLHTLSEDSTAAATHCQFASPESGADITCCQHVRY